MPALPKLRVSLQPEAALTVTRIGTAAPKLCYAMVADRPLRYPKGSSRIAYIGTTSRGIYRLTRSVAEQAEDLIGSSEYYGIRGVRSFEVRVITCTPRPGIKTWRKLERALLLDFKKIFGDVPRLNRQGSGYVERDEFRYFTHARIAAILKELSLSR